MLKTKLPLLGALLSSGLLLAPQAALAHVKWFVEETPEITIEPFSILEPAVVTWILIGTALIGIASNLEHIGPRPNKVFFDDVKKWGAHLVHLFQILIGASLLYAALKNQILLPHYEGSESTQVLRWMEALIGVLLIANRGLVIAGGLLILNYLGAALNFGFGETIDYLNLVGIALFLILRNAPKNSFFKAYQEWDLPLLRVFTGAALIVLAFSEKLLAPEKAMELLNQYDLNFMDAIGLHFFSDRLFVLSAGMMELVFGILFILGIITRINTIALAVFLIASNAYFFLNGHSQEGLTEIMGHLPIIATALLLIAYGSGDKLKLRWPR